MTIAPPSMMPAVGITAMPRAGSTPTATRAVTIAIVVSMMLGYLLFLTELSAVPQMLRSIPALRSRRLRRMRLMTAVIGALETSLPAGFVLAVMFAR